MPQLSWPLRRSAPCRKWKARQGRRVESNVDKKELTQVGNALSQLGITHIPSYSPWGRGRMERVFVTLQKRLPQAAGNAAGRAAALI
jgi:hypothetical protein